MKRNRDSEQGNFNPKRKKLNNLQEESHPSPSFFTTIGEFIAGTIRKYNPISNSNIPPAIFEPSEINEPVLDAPENDFEKVEQKNEAGQSPLFIAIFGDPEAVQSEKALKLIEEGANITSLNHNEHLFFKLLQQEAYQLAAALVDRGLNPNSQFNGRSLLHIAASAGDLKVVKGLIGLGANPNTKDDSDITPIHVAAQKGFTDIVKSLVRSGALVNVPDTQGRTSLHIAADKGNIPLLTALLQQNVDVDPPNNLGETPLMVALYKNRQKKIEGYYVEVAILLLGKGAKLQTLKEKIGAVNLLKDARDHKDLLAAFRNCGLSALNVNAVDEQGATLLHHATSKDEAQALLEQGANIEAKDNFEMTPLFRAVAKGNREMFDYFLSRNANPYHLMVTDQQNIMHLAKGNKHCIFSRYVKSKIQFDPNWIQEREDQFFNLFSTWLSKAKLSNKKLLIILGEAHGEYRIYQLEKAALKAASRMPELSHLFLELKRKIDQNSFSNYMIHEYSRKHLPFTIVAADQYRSGTAFDTSILGMGVRNAGLRDTIEQTNSHGILITGSAHLYGLIDGGGTSLNRDKFYIAPFNLDQLLFVDNSKNRNDFSKDTKKVIQVSETGFDNNTAQKVTFRCNRRQNH